MFKLATSLAFQHKDEWLVGGREGEGEVRRRGEGEMVMWRDPLPVCSAAEALQTSQH